MAGCCGGRVGGEVALSIVVLRLLSFAMIGEG
jgi:hypothetical protein